MQSTDFLSLYFWQLAVHIPSILVYFIGLGFSVFKIRQYTLSAVLSAIGFIILLVISFVAPATTPLSYYMIRNLGYTALQIGQIQGVIGFSLSFLGAIAIALIIAALWTGRQKAPAAIQ